MDSALVIVIITFATVVVVAFAVSAWVARAQSRYMVLRLERLDEVPPLADRPVLAELESKPWLWPLRVGPLWRAQTRYDRTRHLDPELDHAQHLVERRQRVAFTVYILGVAAILLSTLVHI